MSRNRYSKAIATCAALAVVALFLTLILTHSGRAKPRPAPRTPQEPGITEAIREAIKPGNYATAINIHNPSLLATVTIYAKAVQDGGTPSAFAHFTLAPDYAREFDCTDIYAELGLTPPDYGLTDFAKGFVVFFASGSPSLAVGAVPLPLDVVGVYTAEPPSVIIPPVTTPGPNQVQAPGIALEMLNIAPRLETVPVSTVGTATPLPVGRYYEYSAKFLCGFLPIPAPGS